MSAVTTESDRQRSGLALCHLYSYTDHVETAPHKLVALYIANHLLQDVESDGKSWLRCRSHHPSLMPPALALLFICFIYAVPLLYVLRHLRSLEPHHRTGAVISKRGARTNTTNGVDAVDQEALTQPCHCHYSSSRTPSKENRSDAEKASRQAPAISFQECENRAVGHR
jgi:hypothetical protein